jgi:hypothetical protein
VRRPTLGQALAAAAIIAVATVIVLGLDVVGGPEEDRRQRFDARRVQDLDQLAGAVDCYWTLTAELPGDLDLMADRLRTETAARPLPGECRLGSTTDPETAAPYSYRVIDETHYELCATFTAATEREQPSIGSRFAGARRNWQHDAGAHCFPLTATEVRLPNAP